MFEFDQQNNKIIFSHNPFSMNHHAISINFDKPLEIKAYQYDIVCNGSRAYSSGAIRNYFQN